MIQNNSNYIKKQIHLSKRANKEVNGHRCLIFHSGSCIFNQLTRLYIGVYDRMLSYLQFICNTLL